MASLAPPRKNAHGSRDSSLKNEYLNNDICDQIGWADFEMRTREGHAQDSESEIIFIEVKVNFWFNEDACPKGSI